MANAGIVLVLGATGNIGRHLLPQLVARGERVRATSRRPESESLPPEVEWVRFDHDDPSTFAAALAGVDRLFLLCPSGHVDSNAKLSAFLDLACRSVRKIVTLTAQGVELSDEIPHRKLELRVAKSGLAYVHLRPTWFADNFHTYWRNPIRRDGVIPLPAGAAKTAFIDARDIASCAAGVLTTEAFDGRTLVLTGGEALDYHQAAQVLTAAVGRPIQYRTIDKETFLRNAIADGVPPDYARMIVTLFGLVTMGVTAQVTDTVLEIGGKPPRTLSEYAVTYAHLLS
jgi:uncharacterized protein YbjT (DUF2867 family)